MSDCFEREESMKTKAYRPVTSNGFRVPFNLGDPIGSSHYDLTFYEKEIKRQEPIRTGTASGTRANKPHPSKVIKAVGLLVELIYLKVFNKF
jgi:hypothetical protein